MKIAIVGSRGLTVDCIENYVSAEDEIVSGGAKGVDQCAAEYAEKNHLKLTEFLPKYAIYGRAVPIIRNREIVDYADKIRLLTKLTYKITVSKINKADQSQASLV